jgi:hypothetical protein
VHRLMNKVATPNHERATENYESPVRDQQYSWRHNS